MLTFSQLVDQILSEVKRYDKLTEFASYLNQAIREVHFEPSRGNVTFYHDNYREEQLTANSEVGYSWLIPDSARFQGIGAARYDRVLDRDGKPRYAKILAPGPRLEREPYAAQRAGRQVFFKGYGGLGGIISLSYFEYPRALKYYAAGERPATYDYESGWSYLPAYDADDTTRELARTLSTNWIIERWFVVLEEALRAKVFKAVGDETRMRTSYSLYAQLRQGLFTSEVADLGGPY